MYHARKRLALFFMEEILLLLFLLWNKSECLIMKDFATHLIRHPELAQDPESQKPGFFLRQNDETATVPPLSPISHSIIDLFLRR